MSTSIQTVQAPLPYTITLSRGRTCIVDLTDAPRLCALTWRWTEGKRGARGYAIHYDYQHKPRRITWVYMHRFLLAPPAGMQVDHINGDTLDNRRCNLRLCSNQQNQHNRRISRNNTSGYRGVSRHKKNGNWLARIHIPGGPYKHLGCFETPEQAAQAYNDAARAFFGAFARLNSLPEQGPQTAEPRTASP